MSESTLTFGLREVEPGIAIIDVHGDVTPVAESALMDAHGQAGSAHAVILNFSDLAYMNSGGIGLLVTLLVRAQRQKQRLLAYGLTDHYRQIFQLTRLDDVVGVHNDEAAAIAAASG